MAKKTKSAQIVRYTQPSGPRSIVVNVPRPRALATPHKVKHHRRRHGGGGGGDTMFHHMAAGAVLGYLDSNDTAIPTIPILGRAGSLALACYFFRQKSPWLAAGAKTFAAIATYEMIANGSIKGDVAADVSGEYFDEIAPQT